MILLPLLIFQLATVSNTSKDKIHSSLAPIKKLFLKILNRMMTVSNYIETIYWHYYKEDNNMELNIKIALSLYSHIFFHFLGFQEECFTQLRTIRGLGYTVECFTRIFPDSGSFQVLVNSGTFQPQYIFNSIEDFLIKFYLNIAWKFEETKYYSILQSIVEFSHSKKKVVLSDLFRIGKTNLDLDQIEIKLNYDCIRQMTLPTFRSMFYEHFIHEDSRRILTIVIHGYKDKRNPSVDCIISYSSINQNTHDLDHSCI